MEKIKNILKPLLVLIQFVGLYSYGQTLILEFNYPIELKNNTEEIIASCTYADEYSGYSTNEKQVVTDYQKIILKFDFKRMKQVRIELTGSNIYFDLNVLLYPEKTLKVNTNILLKCIRLCDNLDYFNARYTFSGYNAEANKYHAYYYSKYSDDIINERDDYGRVYKIKNDSLSNIYLSEAWKKLEERKNLIDTFIPGTDENILDLKKLLYDKCRYTSAIEILEKIKYYKITPSHYFTKANAFNKPETEDIYLPAFIKFCNSISDFYNTYSAGISFYDLKYFQTYVNSGKFIANKSWEKEYLTWFNTKKSDEKWNIAKFQAMFRNEKVEIDIVNDFYTNFNLSTQYALDSLYIKFLTESDLDKNIIYHKLINRLRESYNLADFYGVTGVSYYPAYLIKNRFITPEHLTLFTKNFDKEQVSFVSGMTEHYRKLTINRSEVESYCKTLKKQQILDSNIQVQRIIKRHKGKIIICQYWDDHYRETDVFYLEHLNNKYKKGNVVFLNFCNSGRKEQIDHFEHYLLSLKERNLDSFCENYLIKRNICFNIIQPKNRYSIYMFDKAGKYIPLNDYTNDPRFDFYSGRNMKYELSTEWLNDYFESFKNQSNTSTGYEGNEMTIGDGDGWGDAIIEAPRPESKYKKEQDSLKKIEMAKPKWEVINYTPPEKLNLSFSKEIESIINGIIISPIANANWIKEELFKNEGWYCIEEPENECIYLSKSNFKTNYSLDPIKWIMNNDSTIFYSISDKEFPVKINLTYNPQKNSLTFNGISYLVFYRDSDLIVLLKGR